MAPRDHDRRLAALERAARDDRSPPLRPGVSGLLEWSAQKDAADRARFATLLRQLAVPPAVPDRSIRGRAIEALDLWDSILRHAEAGQSPLDLAAHAAAAVHLIDVACAAAGRRLAI